ncbi:hypothetical protein FRB99_007284 [Tulasnella sp. 403]|nr:hypothetical protein FRB99_007284 [Tulasnella sp. 403]
MRLVRSIPLFTTLVLAGAWDLSFITRAVFATAPTTQEIFSVKPSPVRIAVIGAGAGGSSSAWWINKAKERHGFDVEVHIFDKNTYIGGRSIVVHPHNDPSLVEELGASIFVRANKNLFRAVEEFGLNTTNLADEDDDMGIWDGNQFLVTLNGGWWDNVKILWRYGYSSPTKARALVAKMIEDLLVAYTPTLPHWKSVHELGEALGFSQFTSETGYEYYTRQGVSDKFTKELIEIGSRVNYAQDITSIHGLGGAVSMATGGASQVTGGNYQMFEGFVKHSDAKVFLNTTITGLSKSKTSGKTEWTLSGTSTNIPLIPYDHVILTTPFHLSGITLLGSSAEFPPVEYVHLHVTLLSTTSFRPRPEKFGWAPGSSLPKNILTTAEGVRNGGPAPDFQSISYHKTFVKDGREEHIFKIFSLDHKSDEWLEEVFGKGTLGWVYRKEWDSYPKLPPTKVFPPVKPDEGLWYVNNMEPWISTMETEVLSARNVVENMLYDAFGVGICPNGTSTEGWGTKVEDTKVYGWDC